MTRQDILKTVLLERLLSVNKSSIWHEIKLQKLAEAEQIETKNTKQEWLKKERIKDITNFFDAKIERCEKYNNEINNYFKNVGVSINIEGFTNDCQDMLNDYLNLFIKEIEKIEEGQRLDLTAAILKKDDAGLININRVRYNLIH